jgi:hypothetical protein
MASRCPVLPSVEQTNIPQQQDLEVILKYWPAKKMKGQKIAPQNIAYGPYRCTDLARLHDGAIAIAMNADSFACYAVGQ